MDNSGFFLFFPNKEQLLIYEKLSDLFVVAPI